MLPHPAVQVVVVGGRSGHGAAMVGNYTVWAVRTGRVPLHTACSAQLPDRQPDTSGQLHHTLCQYGMLMHGAALPRDIAPAGLALAFVKPT